MNLEWESVTTVRKWLFHSNCVNFNQFWVKSKYFEMRVYVKRMSKEHNYLKLMKSCKKVPNLTKWNWGYFLFNFQSLLICGTCCAPRPIRYFHSDKSNDWGLVWTLENFRSINIIIHRGERGHTQGWPRWKVRGVSREGLWKVFIIFEILKNKMQISTIFGAKYPNPRGNLAKREKIGHHPTLVLFPSLFLLSVELSVFDLFVFQPPVFPKPLAALKKWIFRSEFSRQ